MYHAYLDVIGSWSILSSVWFAKLRWTDPADNSRFESVPGIAFTLRAKPRRCIIEGPSHRGLFIGLVTVAVFLQGQEHVQIPELISFARSRTSKSIATRTVFKPDHFSSN